MLDEEPAEDELAVAAADESVDAPDELAVAPDVSDVLVDVAERTSTADVFVVVTAVCAFGITKVSSSTNTAKATSTNP